MYEGVGTRCVKLIKIKPLKHSEKSDFNSLERKKNKTVTTQTFLNPEFRTKVFISQTKVCVSVLTEMTVFKSFLHRCGVAFWDCVSSVRVNVSTTSPLPLRSNVSGFFLPEMKRR